MNFKDLKNIKPTLMSHGLPSSTMTDKEWQTEFELLKLYIRPYPKTITRMASKYLRETVKKDENDEIKYDGRTSWQSYCWYINDVLSQIRLGNVDFCFYKYQIEQLLKFHHNTLKTRFCDGWYWEVWLER